MINVNDIEKIKELFERANELPVKDLYAAKEILNELLGVAKRNPEINIMDEYDSLLSQFEDGEINIMNGNWQKEIWPKI